MAVTDQAVLDEHILARRRAAQTNRQLAPPPPVMGSFAGRPMSATERARSNVTAHGNAVRRLGHHVGGISTLFGPAVAHPLELLVEDVTENAGEAFHHYELALDEADREATRMAERLGEVGLARQRLLTVIGMAAHEVERRYRGNVPPRFQVLLDVAAEPF